MPNAVVSDKAHFTRRNQLRKTPNMKTTRTVIMIALALALPRSYAQEHTDHGYQPTDKEIVEQSQERARQRQAAAEAERQAAIQREEGRLQAERELEHQKMMERLEEQRIEREKRQQEWAEKQRQAEAAAKLRQEEQIRLNRAQQEDLLKLQKSLQKPDTDTVPEDDRDE